MPPSFIGVVLAAQSVYAAENVRFSHPRFSLSPFRPEVVDDDISEGQSESAVLSVLPEVALFNWPDFIACRSALRLRNTCLSRSGRLLKRSTAVLVRTFSCCLVGYPTISRDILASLTRSLASMKRMSSSRVRVDSMDIVVGIDDSRMYSM